MRIHTAAVHNSSRLDPTRIIHYCAHTHTHTHTAAVYDASGVDTHTHTHTAAVYDSSGTSSSGSACLALCACLFSVLT